MTGKQRIEAAFSAEGTREVPAAICYEGIYIRDHWDALTGHPWWYQQSPDLAHQLAWRRDVIAATPQDWICLSACASREERESVLVEVRADGVFRIDHRTGHEDRLRRPVVGGWDRFYATRDTQPPRLPTTPQEVDALVGLPEPFDGEALVAEGRADLAAELLATSARDLFPFAHTTSPLWTSHGLWGFEGLMVLVAERPDLVRRACERLLPRCIQRAEVAAALGAKAVWIEECFTDMIGPAAFADLNLPFLERLIEAIHSLGMKSVYYYCGDPEGKWEQILSLGMDALSLEEGKKGFVIDIEDVVERVSGRCAALGNLDAIGLLEHGTEEQLRAEIARQIAAGRANGGRFIMSIGSPVTPGTPPERVRLYCDLVHDLG